MENKFRILNSIVSNYETHFDKDVINYLLDNIDDSFILKEETIGSQVLTNFEIKTNFYGKVLLKTIRIEDENLTKGWEDILGNKNSKYKDTTFKYSHLVFKPNKVFECNLDTVKVLNDLVYYSKNKDEFKNVNEEVIALELLSEKQSSSINLAKLSKKDSDVLLGIVFNNRDKLESTLGGSRAFLDKVVKSKVLENLLFINSNAEAEKYLKKEDLGILIMDCLIKNFNHMKPLTVLSVLNKFPEKDWVDSLEEGLIKVAKKNYKNFPMLLVFKELFYSAYGLNITEEKNSEVGIRYTEKPNIWSFDKIDKLLKIANYLLPAIKEKNISQEQIAEFYNSALRMNDTLLVEALNKTFPLDEVRANLKDEKLSKAISEKLSEDKFRVHVIQKDLDNNGVNRRQFKSWKEWKINLDRNNLERSLSSKDAPKRKIKI